VGRDELRGDSRIITDEGRGRLNKINPDFGSQRQEWV
jgi:hypothetical protein